LHICTCTVDTFGTENMSSLEMFSHLRCQNVHIYGIQ